MYSTPPSRNGFTLIELMASMVILAIAVLVVAMVFNDATKAWDIGTRRVESNNVGRAVVDMIARDLSTAIADTNLSFKVENDNAQLYVQSADQMAFVSSKLRPKASGERASEKVWYYVARMQDTSGSDVNHRYRLMRGWDDVDTAYGNPTWYNANPSTKRTLAENISAFEIRTFHLESNPTGPIANYDSTALLAAGEEYALPTFIEVYLEVLDEKDAATAQMMHEGSGFSAAERRSFVERMAKRYVARVYPNNREGYRVMTP